MILTVGVYPVALWASTLAPCLGQVKKPTSLQGNRPTKKESKIDKKSIGDAAKSHQKSTVGHLGLSWGGLGVILGDLGAILECLGSILAPRGPKIPKKVKKGTDRSGLGGGLLGAMLASSWARMGPESIKNLIKILVDVGTDF